MVGADLDLRDGFHGDGDALLGVKILLRGDVEAHELEGEGAVGLDDREDDGAALGDDAGVAIAVDDDGFVGTGLAVKAADGGEQEQHGEDGKTDDDEGWRCAWLQWLSLGAWRVGGWLTVGWPRLTGKGRTVLDVGGKEDLLAERIFAPEADPGDATLVAQHNDFCVARDGQAIFRAGSGGAAAPRWEKRISPGSPGRIWLDTRARMPIISVSSG